MPSPKLKNIIQRNFALNIAIPLIIMSTLMVIFYYNSSKQQIITENSVTTGLLTNIIRGDIKVAEDLLTTLALAIDYQAPNRELNRIVFENIIASHKNLVEIRILDSNGVVDMVIPYNIGLDGLDMSGATFLKNAKSKGTPSWSKASLSSITGSRAAFLAVPMAHGSIVASFNLSILNKTITEFGVKEGVQIGIVDQGGFYLSHADSAKALRRDWEPLAQQIRATSLESSNNIISFEDDNQIVTGSLVSNTGWLVMLFVKKNSLISPIQKLSLYLIVLSFFLTIIGVYFSFKTSANYFSHIQRLITKIHEVSDGKYKNVAPIEVFQELKEVEHDFHNMANTIENRESEIISLNKKLEGQLFEAENIIKQRDKAQAGIEEAHNTFMTVLNGIDAAVTVIDISTCEILFVNSYVEALLDVDVLGTTCWKSFKMKNERCSVCNIDMLTNDSGKPTMVNVWQGKSLLDGKEYLHRDRAIKWIDGRLARLQIATDITPFKEIEEKLRQSQKMESIGTLAGGIAHDFNNILVPLIGYTEIMLEETPADNNFRQYLEEMYQAELRARDLVKQILTFSRQNIQEFKPIKIQDILDEVLKLVRATIPSTISIKHFFNSECGSILGDPVQVHQIVMNLIINASHSMEKNGGVIDIHLDELLLTKDNLPDSDILPGRYVSIKIKDTGTGMEPNITDKIFDPYFTTKPLEKGSGLGLAVVHGSIKALNGAITVESEIGHGSTFTVFFPIYELETKTLKKEVIEKSSLHTNAKIIVIDDEIIVLDMIKAMLTKLGYEVSPFLDARDALSAISKEPSRYDLVITDMTMPRMTGDVLATEVLSIRPDMPIIICTGFSNRISEEAINTMGIKMILSKPMRKAELALAVSTVLQDHYS